MILYWKEMLTEVGNLKAVASDKALVAVLWEVEKPNRVKLDEEMVENQTHPILLKTEKELSEFLVGRRTAFNVPIAPRGSDFQKRVWKALHDIPYGTTLSYTDLAIRLGQPRALRAIGTAIGKNPISMLIPCHRVVGSDGSLRGFAGGLRNKAYLLCIEGNADTNCCC